MSQRDWEEHYRVGDTPWNHGEAAPGLVDFLGANPGLDRRRVLVPGCGFRHDALAWARAGFPTVGMDLAPSAAEAATRLAPSGVPVQFRAGDFLDPSVADGAYGWVFEHTLYCAIQPAQRDEYVEALGRWLGPGGQFVAVHYMNPAAPEGPPFGCTRDELMRRFGREFELVADWRPRSWESRAGREWMFWWRRR